MRKPLPLIAVLVASALPVAAPAKACMWDSDTIAEERSKFPTAMEILAGKYNRHSQVFYEWRIKDRQKKLAADPNNLALLDDLGVALCKTGKFKEAVAIGERALALDAKRYKSLSNLGTYHIFTGDLEKSAELINAALAIEPDAHFGREKYQLYLVEYMMDVKRINGAVKLPLKMAWPEWESDAYKALSNEDRNKIGELSHIGYRFFVDKPNPPERRQENLARATHGVLGMMRFANDELPVLNEIAGDLLNIRNTNQLASRAYLKASYHTPNTDAQALYRMLADRAVGMQTNVKFTQLESDFKDELAQGQTWQAQIAADEAGWIAEGKDPEAEFNKKYRADNEPTIWLNPISVVRQFFQGWFTGPNAFVGWGLLLFAIPIALYIRGYRKRRKAGKSVLDGKHQSFKLTR